MTHGTAFLRQSSQHNYHNASLLPDELPEVCGGLRKCSLRRNVRWVSRVVVSLKFEYRFFSISFRFPVSHGKESVVLLHQACHSLQQNLFNLQKQAYRIISSSYNHYE